MGRFDRPPFEGNGWVEGNRICWEGEGEILWLEPYGKDSLRFRASKSLHIQEDLNWTLLPAEKNDSTKITVTKEKAIIVNGKLTAHVWGDGSVDYFDASGKALLKESWVDSREFTVPLRRAREYDAISSDSFEIELYFKADPDEHFYGMGQDPNDCFDLKGSTIPLEQKNTKCTVPIAISTNGYGFYWNNPAIGEAQFVNNHTKWSAKMAKQIDYIMIVGDKPADIMERYTAMSGRAPVLPEWAAGFWQCKLRYETQDEILEVAREYKKRGIPVSVIVIDYFHWTMQGEWKFDPKKWPNPTAMSKELADMGIRLMVSIWPTVDVRSENYLEMNKKNYLMRAEAGVSFFKMMLGSNTFYDPMHPGARDFVWGKVKKHYYDHGIKMFWLDESEPSLTPYHYKNARYYLGNALEVSSLYPYYYAKTFYDGMKKEGEKEVVNLLRCAWHGS
ncbi:MAG: TIM-barrel domain-containing protein, partial [Treponemataceae bacterium]